MNNYELKFSTPERTARYFASEPFSCEHCPAVDVYTDCKAEDKEDCVKVNMRWLESEASDE